MSVLINQMPVTPFNPGVPAQNPHNPQPPLIATLTVQRRETVEEKCQYIIDQFSNSFTPREPRTSLAKELLKNPDLVTALVKKTQDRVSDFIQNLFYLNSTNPVELEYGVFCNLIEADAKVDALLFKRWMGAPRNALPDRAINFMLDHPERPSLSFCTEDQAFCFENCELGDIERFVNCHFDINARFNRRMESKNETVLLRLAKKYTDATHQVSRSSFNTEEGFLNSIKEEQAPHLERVRVLLANGANPHFKNLDGEKPSDLCEPGTDMHALLIANEADWSACEACTEEEEDEIESSWKKLPEPERAELATLRLNYQKKQVLLKIEARSVHQDREIF